MKKLKKSQLIKNQNCFWRVREYLTTIKQI